MCDRGDEGMGTLSFLIEVLHALFHGFDGSTRRALDPAHRPPAHSAIATHAPLNEALTFKEQRWGVSFYL